METKRAETTTAPALSMNNETICKDNNFIDSALILSELNTLSKQFDEMPAPVQPDTNLRNYSDISNITFGFYMVVLVLIETILTL